MDNDLASRRALAPLTRPLGLPEGFARLGATGKLNALLDLSDPGRVIRHLRPDELYGLVREIGIEDAWDLVLLGTPEQRQAIRDLEVWSEDQYDPERLDRILDLSVHAGLEHGLAVVRDSDPEMLALHVFAQARVSLVRDEEERPARDTGALDEEERPDQASFLSPDGVFLIRCEDPDRVPSVRRLLDLMYAEGVEFAQRILFAGMHDTPGSLEAQARHFREMRLQDLGFPPPEERFAIWEPFDAMGLKDLIERQMPRAEGPDALDAGRHPLALVLAGQDSPPLFWEALASVAGDPSLPALVHRLLYLVNKVLAARTTTFHDDSAWEAAAAHVLDLVSLGLEHLSGSDRERAGQVLVAVHPQHLYRTGVEVLRPLNLIARAVLREVGGMTRLAILGESRADVVRAALVFPPERPIGVGRAPAWTLEDATRTRIVLADALAVLRFARAHLGFAPASHPAGARIRALSEPTLANALATAWARQVLRGDPSIEPLTGEEVRDLLVAGFEGGRIRPALREITLPSPLSETEAHAVRTFLDEALTRVEESLGRLDPGRPVDARFVGDCLLVREGAGPGEAP